jgi:hypothetical protein
MDSLIYIDSFPFGNSEQLREKLKKEFKACFDGRTKRWYVSSERRKKQANNIIAEFLGAISEKKNSINEEFKNRIYLDSSVYNDSKREDEITKEYMLNCYRKHVFHKPYSLFADIIKQYNLILDENSDFDLFDEVNVAINNAIKTINGKSIKAVRNKMSFYSYCKDNAIAAEKDINTRYNEIIKDKWHPSDEIKFLMIRQNGNSIQFIESPSDEMKMDAIKQNGEAIQFIENPSEEMKVAAVWQNWRAIKFIENPSEKVQLLSVGVNAKGFKYIDNPCATARKIYRIKLISEAKQSERRRMFTNPLAFTGPRPTFLLPPRFQNEDNK